MHRNFRSTALGLAALMLAFSIHAGQVVDINTANAQTLASSLDGVGLNKAEAIVAYRAQHGPFQHADELVKVKGIGLATVDKNRNYIKLKKERKTTGSD